MMSVRFDESKMTVLHSVHHSQQTVLTLDMGRLDYNLLEPPEPSIWITNLPN